MAWVFELIDKRFLNFQEITKKNKEFIIEQLSAINKIIEYNELFTEFQGSYDEYLISLDGTDRKKANDIVRYTKNYLASYKSYLDGMETILSRTFDKKIYKSFKKLQSKAYDSSFDYRFIYNLRNYAQHCGSPISNIKRSINEEAIISLKVDKFLSEHKGMQTKFRKELNELEYDYINVGSAIKSVNDIMIDMQDNIFDIMIDDETDEVVRSAYNLIEFYNKYSKNNGVLYIAKDSDIEGIAKFKKAGPNKVNVEFNQIPHKLARLVLEGNTMQYIFKGRNVGKSKTFPVMLKANSVIEIPKFLTGEEIVLNKGLKWLKVEESIGLDFKDGYDYYASIYVLNGLSVKSYNEIANKFKDKAIDLLQRI